MTKNGNAKKNVEVDSYINETIDSFKKNNELIDKQLSRIETAINTISQVCVNNNQSISKLNERIEQINYLREVADKSKQYIDRLENGNDSRKEKLIIISSMIKLFDKLENNDIIEC